MSYAEHFTIRISHPIFQNYQTLQITATFPEACSGYRTWWKKKTLLMIAVESDNILAASSVLWAVQQTLGPAYLEYLNEASSSGNTALILAAKYGNEAILRLLLEEGATPLPANRRGQAAVHLAAHRGHTECLQLILDVPIRSTLGGSRIAALASVHDYAGECRYIDAHDRAGFTALHLAAVTRSSAAVAALVERGATLDTPVLRGMERLPFLCGGSTPLHIAAAQGDARTCLILLDGQWRHPGLELRRVRNMLGLTPLNCAILGGHHDVVRILLESGGRTGRGGRRGRTSAAAANGLGDPLSGSAATSLYRMVPLSAAFPDSLREHMLAVLQRAALLLQLRDIAGEWKAEGAAQPTDTTIVSNMPLLSLTLPQINGLQSLLRRRETSLKDFLYGLESTLRGTATNSGRRVRRRVRRRAAAAAVEAAAAAAEGSEATATAGAVAVTSNQDSEEMNTERGTEIGQITIAELQPSPSSSDEEDEENVGGDVGRQRNDDLERALHEISGQVIGGGTSNGATSASTPAANEQQEGKPPSSPAAGAAATASAAAMPTGQDDDCSICMDAKTEISFLPCSHALCFHCACRLCARGTDAATCPFCRQPVESCVAVAGARSRVAKGKEDASASTEHLSTTAAVSLQ
jgi:ankyrin repeat protein